MKQDGKSVLYTEDHDDLAEIIKRNLGDIHSTIATADQWGSPECPSSQSCKTGDDVSRIERHRQFWSNRVTRVNSASTGRFLYLETKLSSLLLNLEVRRSTSDVPHLWHRSWNTYVYRDHSSRSKCCWLKKYARQLPMPERYMVDG